jgi:hypothetical protein
MSGLGFGRRVIGKRSYLNAEAVPRALHRMDLEPIPLITIDGFKFCERVIGRVFGQLGSTVR